MRFIKSTPFGTQIANVKSEMDDNYLKYDLVTTSGEMIKADMIAPRALFLNFWEEYTA